MDPRNLELQPEGSTIPVPELVATRGLRRNVFRYYQVSFINIISVFVCWLLVSQEFLPTKLAVIFKSFRPFTDPYTNPTKLIN
jgi:hypothetical protein